MKKKQRSKALVQVPSSSALCVARDAMAKEVKSSMSSAVHLLFKFLWRVISGDLVRKIWMTWVQSGSVRKVNVPKRSFITGTQKLRHTEEEETPRHPMSPQQQQSDLSHENHPQIVPEPQRPPPTPPLRPTRELYSYAQLLMKSPMGNRVNEFRRQLETQNEESSSKTVYCLPTDLTPSLLLRVSKASMRPAIASDNIAVKPINNNKEQEQQQVDRHK